MCANGHHMSRFSFAPAWVRTLPAKLAGIRGAVAALGLMGASPDFSQPCSRRRPWGRRGASGCWPARRSPTQAPTVINGNVGVSPGSAVTGFTPGLVNGIGRTIHAADAVALQAQSDDTTAYNILAGQAIHDEPDRSGPGRQNAYSGRLRF